MWQTDDSYRINQWWTTIQNWCGRAEVAAGEVGDIGLFVYVYTYITYIIKFWIILEWVLNHCWIIFECVLSVCWVYFERISNVYFEWALHIQDAFKIQNTCRIDSKRTHTVKKKNIYIYTHIHCISYYVYFYVLCFVFIVCLYTYVDWFYFSVFVDLGRFCSSYNTYIHNYTQIYTDLSLWKNESHEEYENPWNMENYKNRKMKVMKITRNRKLWKT